MTALLGKSHGESSLPNTLAVQLVDFPFTVEAQLSPSKPILRCERDWDDQRIYFNGEYAACIPFFNPIEQLL